MRLKGIEFGKVLGASGVQGFFGEGYWFHHCLRPIGLDFSDITFVAKTTTLQPRAGNMLLRNDFTPKAMFPRCIYAKPWRGMALNAIGLSGPGAVALFETGLWQKREEPFFLSFMPVGGSENERMSELSSFVKLLQSYLPSFRAPVGLQINYSCPNVGHRPDMFFNEVGSGLSVASQLGIPLMPKFNLLIPAAVARDISNHPFCDALCISNTVPYGELPDKIDWQKLFGPTSPLQQYGGGGLSGKPLLPILLEWLDNARSAGITKPINAGGGILSLGDARRVLEHGADSIFLGSISFLRPWRIARIGRALNP